MDTAEVLIGRKRIKAEIMESFWDKARGLMFRDSLGPGEGMLFVFRRPQVLRFWMLFMRFPIDIVFLDEERRVIRIYHEAKPTLNPFGRLYSSEKPAKYALEVRAGFCKRYGVKETMNVGIKRIRARCCQS